MFRQSLCLSGAAKFPHIMIIFQDKEVRFCEMDVCAVVTGGRETEIKKDLILCFVQII